MNRREGWVLAIAAFVVLSGSVRACELPEGWNDGRTWTPVDSAVIAEAGNLLFPESFRLFVEWEYEDIDEYVAGGPWDLERILLFTRYVITNESGYEDYDYARKIMNYFSENEAPTNDTFTVTGPGAHGPEVVSKFNIYIYEAGAIGYEDFPDIFLATGTTPGGGMPMMGPLEVASTIFVHEWNHIVYEHWVYFYDDPIQKSFTFKEFLAEYGEYLIGIGYEYPHPYDSMYTESLKNDDYYEGCGLRESKRNPYETYMAFGAYIHDKDPFNAPDENHIVYKWIRMLRDEVDGSGETIQVYGHDMYGLSEVLVDPMYDFLFTSYDRSERLAEFLDGFVFSKYLNLQVSSGPEALFRFVSCDVNDLCTPAEICDIFEDAGGECYNNVHTFPLAHYVPFGGGQQLSMSGFLNWGDDYCWECTDDPGGRDWAGNRLAMSSEYGLQVLEFLAEENHPFGVEDTLVVELQIPFRVVCTLESEDLYGETPINVPPAYGERLRVSAFAFDDAQAYIQFDGTCSDRGTTSLFQMGKDYPGNVVHVEDWVLNEPEPGDKLVMHIPFSSAGVDGFHAVALLISQTPIEPHNNYTNYRSFTYATKVPFEYTWYIQDLGTPPYFSGVISEDMTLGNVYIDGPIVIEPDVTLTIAAGANVYIVDPDVYIEVNGILEMLGTQEYPIHVKRWEESGGEETEWRGIEVGAGGDVRMEHVEIEDYDHFQAGDRDIGDLAFDVNFEDCILWGGEVELSSIGVSAIRTEFLGVSQVIVGGNESSGYAFLSDVKIRQVTPDQGFLFGSAGCSIFRGTITENSAIEAQDVCLSLQGGAYLELNNVAVRSKANNESAVGLYFGQKTTAAIDGLFFHPTFVPGVCIEAEASAEIHIQNMDMSYVQGVGGGVTPNVGVYVLPLPLGSRRDPGLPAPGSVNITIEQSNIAFDLCSEWYGDCDWLRESKKIVDKTDYIVDASEVYWGYAMVCGDPSVCMDLAVEGPVITDNPLSAPISLVDPPYFSIGQVGGDPDTGAPIQLMLYPNPSSNSLTVNLAGEREAADRAMVTVYDVTGRRVMEPLSFEKTGPYTIHLQNEQGQPLSAGVYFVRVVSGERAVVRKFVVVQ